MSQPLPSRRRFLSHLASGAAAGAAVGAGLHGLARPAAALASLTSSRFVRPRPTAAQLAWQQDELALFVHFGINTFTDREWGDGTESPSLFAPTALDARQWARAAKAAGARAMVLTAKHHDGFCLWPTATTRHSVASSPWKDGRGDVVRAFVDACRAEGLSPGLYCSPWDRNHPTYGDSPRYNDVYVAQLTELLTRYGALSEMWFDGANGEGPNGKRQVYDWPRIWDTVRRLQPKAVIFSDVGPDVRWIGNERGVAGETHWSTIRPESVPQIGASGDDVIRALQEGHAEGSVWRPGETDVSIRPGWFHHPAEDTRVKSTAQLVDIFFTSVGRNSKLLLNVPPTRTGQFHETDVARLRDMRRTLDDLFAKRLTPSQEAWVATGARTARTRVLFTAPQHVAVVEARERITEGQRVSAWRLLDDSTGAELLRGTTIGYRQLRRVKLDGVRGVRLEMDTVDVPVPVEVRLYGP